MLDGNLIAVAAGTGGVWIVDVTDRAAPRVVAQVPLETTAHRLRKVGTKLYVLGSYLAVLDVADPRAPRELKQWFTTSDTTTTASQEAMGITRDINAGRRVHVYLIFAGYWTSVKDYLCEDLNRCLTNAQLTASRNAELLTSLERLGVPAGNVHFLYPTEEDSDAEEVARAAMVSRSL